MWRIVSPWVLKRRVEMMLYGLTAVQTLHVYAVEEPASILVFPRN
jgi:hypothetical protein